MNVNAKVVHLDNPISHWELDSVFHKTTSINENGSLRSTLWSRVLNGNAKISSFLLQDIDGLEVIGTNMPRALVTECCGPIRQEAEEEKEQTDMKNANLWDFGDVYQKSNFP